MPQKSQKVRVLTTDQQWIPKIVDALLEGRPCILPTGCGAYILAAAFNTKGKSNIKRSMEAKAALNRAKNRSLDMPVAYTIPPEEIVGLVDEKHQAQIHKTIMQLISKPFGIIAPINEKVPDWHKVYDSLHGVHEKLFVWPDAFNVGPISDIFKYVRKDKKLTLEEFSVVASSANLRGRGREVQMNDFEAIYGQLGDSSEIAYAVKDLANTKGEYSNTRTTIVSTLPFTQGRNELHIVRVGSLGVEEVKELLPNAQELSSSKLLIYSLIIKTQGILRIRNNLLKNINIKWS